MTVYRPKEPSRWLEELQNIARKGSELITANGWIQDQMTGDSGELCIISAGHEAARETQNPGLSHALREVLAHLGHAEGWNDHRDRSQVEVIDFLDQVTITEQDLESTFGPRWELVLYLVEAFGSMDKETLEGWNRDKDQVQDHWLLREIDFDFEYPFGSVEARLLRARGAVVASYVDNCVELGVTVLAPSVALMVTQTLLPSLAS